jgi:hypothetical protein
VGVRAWQRFLLGGLLLAAIAVAGIALNFTLLGLTRDQNDPVGKLSPRAVFSDRSATTTPASPVTTSVATTTSGGHDDSKPGSDHPLRPGDGDSDD